VGKTDEIKWQHAPTGWENFGELKKNCNDQLEK